MDNEELLNEADIICKDILNAVQIDKNGMYWEISTFNGLSKSYENRISENIYDGNAGVLVFLMEFYKLSGNQYLLPIIESSLSWLIIYCKEHPTTNYAFYTGRGGVCYVFTKAFELFGDYKYLDEAISLMDGCTNEDALKWNNGNFDLLSGISGTLLALLHLYNQTKNEALIKKMSILLNLIIDRFKYNKQGGISWNRSFYTMNSLCGFSHGAAGIAWVLYEIATYFSDDNLKNLAYLTSIYEQSWFCKTTGNWPDLRTGIYDEQEINKALEKIKEKKDSNFKDITYMSAWCHGAPGIGIARLRMFQLTNVEQFFSEAEIAMRTTLKSVEDIDDRTNFSLCHGVGGNCYLLSLFSKFDNYSNKQDVIKGLQRSLQAAIEQRKKIGYYRSGILRNTDLIDRGLFNGSAGVGYFILFSSTKSMGMDILCPKVHAEKRTSRNLDIKNVYHKFFENLYPLTVSLIRTIEPSLLEELFSYEQKIGASFLRKDIEERIRFAISRSKWGVVLKDLFRFENYKIKCDDLCDNDSFVYLKEIENNRIDNDVIDFSSVIQLSPFCKLVKTKWMWSKKDILNSDVKQLFEKKGTHFFIFKRISGGVKEFLLNDFSTIVVSLLKKPIVLDVGIKKIGDVTGIGHNSEDLLIQQIKSLLKANILVLRKNP